MSEMTLVIAVAEMRCEFSHIAFADWLATQRAETLCAGTPAVHQYEFHVQLHQARTV